MKTLLLALLSLSLSSGVGFAQATLGSVTYNLVRSAGRSGLFVYGVDESNPTVMVQGDSASYANRNLIGTSGYWVELWAGTTEASLAPVAGSLAIYGRALDASKKLDIASTQGGDVVLLQLRVWADVALRWADLVNHPEAAFGMSKPFTMRLGGAAADGTLYLPLSVGSAGFENFGLARMPEPSALGLVVLGGAAMVGCRRRSRIRWENRSAVRRDS